MNYLSEAKQQTIDETPDPYYPIKPIIMPNSQPTQTLKAFRKPQTSQLQARLIDRSLRRPRHIFTDSKSREYLPDTGICTLPSPMGTIPTTMPGTASNSNLGERKFHKYMIDTPDRRPSRQFQSCSPAPHSPQSHTSAFGKPNSISRLSTEE